MEMAADQTQLYEDLCAKLEQQEDEAQLIHFMAGVLGSLLRRKGDAQFRDAVQNAFADGLAGRPWPQQRDLAREVIAMVIAKRPEVALAWQRVSGEAPHPLARRAVDVTAEDDLPEISLEPVPETPPPPADSFEAFLAAVADDFVGALAHRLALFKVPAQRFPSPTYVHEQPFVLHAPAFPAAARTFFCEVLLPLWRDPLETLYQRQPGVEAAVAVVGARADLWQLVTGRLGRLARKAAGAGAKLAAVRAGGPDYQMVEVPVTRKRTLSVLGVSFSLGSTTETVTRKVPVKPPSRPSSEEMLARDLENSWHEVAQAAGLELPAVADLGLLHDLLTFDAERLAGDMPGLLSLVCDENAEAEAVLDGIEAVAAEHPPLVADALAITLFAHGATGGFGFEELVRLGMRLPLAAHPYLAAEIVRRPRDLAFQVRDGLRRRLDRNNMGLAVVMLFEAWRALANGPHGAALEAAQTVFSAFPIAFAGDPAEAAFSDIGAILAKGLAAPELDSAGTLEAVMRVYGTVVAATGTRL